jgi:hypothetical protein
METETASSVRAMETEKKKKEEKKEQQERGAGIVR